MLLENDDDDTIGRYGTERWRGENVHVPVGCCSGQQGVP
jgi:hypothetical protein